jgi:hypothetical protein
MRYGVLGTGRSIAGLAVALACAATPSAAAGAIPAAGIPERPAAATAVEPGAAPPAPGSSRRLSNERTLSLWAYLRRRTWARRAPSVRARRIRFLRTLVKGTGSPELLLLLREHVTRRGEVWVKVRLPMRPNNTTGWVLRRRLGGYRAVRKQLVIDRRHFIASLYAVIRGRRRKIWTSRIGVGEPRWPTPGGRFYVRERLVVPRTPYLRMWYGPFAFGTSAHAPTLTGGNWGEGVVGVHGTGWPWLIPGRVSHGCVRVYNHKIRRLRRLMRLGTPILIR